MVRTCPRCRRINPASACFCHFDGIALDALAWTEGRLGRSMSPLVPVERRS